MIYIKYHYWSIDAYRLTPDGIANKSNWLSALVSTGDSDRKGKICGCITEVTLERSKALKADGHEPVGRFRW